VERDWFYDPGLHGVDWPAIGEMYRKFVPYCGNRSDLTYLIGEMISELNAGHTYVSGGDDQAAPKKIGTGLLGADFDTPDGAAFHRIAHIVPGKNWDKDERSPLAAPDCPIKEGDYLIAIDGEEIRADDNVYRLLENKAEKVVRLTYNARPSKDGAKTCRVTTIAGESPIRYHEWVEKNRAAVAIATGGRVGYLHLPDMQEAGLIEFAKAFYPQSAMEGFVIDERYNGGGFVGDMIIDRLERKLWAVTQAREGKTATNPEGAFHGHFVVLINEDTGSNGEYFAQAIKLKGLAKLIGMRTWGGAVGIEPHQPLVDGGTITPPQFAPYGLDAKWMIEGHGVDPDVEVQNIPGDVLKGRDAQLEAGIAYLIDKLEKEPMKIPPTPPFPKKPKKP
jgi:tricorn protease